MARFLKRLMSGILTIVLLAGCSYAFSEEDGELRGTWRVTYAVKNGDQYYHAQNIYFGFEPNNMLRIAVLNGSSINFYAGTFNVYKSSYYQDSDLIDFVINGETYSFNYEINRDMMITITDVHTNGFILNKHNYYDFEDNVHYLQGAWTSDVRIDYNKRGKITMDFSDNDLLIEIIADGDPNSIQIKCEYIVWYDILLIHNFDIGYSYFGNAQEFGDFSEISQDRFIIDLDGLGTLRFYRK